MYCNQIFSILKKIVKPVETPVEDIPLKEEVIEETPTGEVTEEEQTEPATVSDEVIGEPNENISEEITEESPVEDPTETESEEPIEEETEPEETVTENTEEESPTYVVVNVIVCKSYEIASRIARCELGESALAIETTLYPVAIGDTYKDGIFYDSEGNVIERNLTEQENIELLQKKNAEQALTIERQAEEISLLNDMLLGIVMG